MKKFFTLCVSALLFGSTAATAQTLRKTWDFREGFSTRTVNALKADQEEFGDNKYWRNYEGDATKADEAHFWNASGEAKNADGFACTHNGGQERVIEELDGLVLGFTAAKKFVVTYNGAQSPNEFESEGGPAIGEMIPHGKSYIWLNGKNETIKFKAAVNQTIKIGIESHAVNKSSLGQARGISLTTSAGSLEQTVGNAVPTYYTECEWELTGDEGTIAELTIKTTNGCHIYYIIVGEGDDPNANKIPVAYVTEGDATAEPAYQQLSANPNLNITLYDGSLLTGFRDPQFLEPYKAVVISPNLPADSYMATLMKQAVAFYPILNLNPALYAEWGYGEAAPASMPLAIISDLKSDLFAGFEEDVDYILADGEIPAVQLGAETFTGVKLGEYFATDPLLAYDPNDAELAAVHVHNTYHNAYIYMPAEAVGMAPKLLSNAIDVLAASKSTIEQAPAPKITMEYKHLNTNIVLNMASSALPKPQIFYTLDGTDPTEQSTLYTEPINVTAETVVKAVAIAEGYLLSDVAEATAQIFSQPATPVIATAYEEGKTIVTLTCDTEGADIWYNYSGIANDTTKSMKYTDALAIALPTDLTAFAVAGGQVFSELAQQRIVVKNVVVRQDQIGLFDANAADWQNGGGSTVYYFSWGKNAKSIYNTEAEPISTIEDPETGDVTYVYPENDYEYYVPANEENYWEVKSKGQVMIWQNLSVGSDPGNGEGYNPETAGDILSYAKTTNHDIQFGGKTSGEPCTGTIQSLKKFQGPFDIVTVVGTASGGSNVGKMLVEISTDSLNWIAVGDTMTTSTVKRLWKTYTRSYDAADEVYVRVVQAGGGSSVQIYNIYILNEGEQSLILKEQYDAEFEQATQGIVSVSKTAVPAGIYTLDGVRHTDMQRGINIVVGSDGTAHKVLR